ncbi:MAG: hypothetical protein KC635_15310, partial [Myxococcales bacterium]|nr:hypothetical protein [Myxococcales bacterium]
MRALAKLSLALGVTGLLLLTLAGTAAAQTDLVLDVPDVLAPNVQFNVNAAYSLNGGTYDDVVVTLELPAHVTIITTTLEADTFPEQACAANATTGGTTCTFGNPALDAGGGLAGTITVLARLDRYAWPDGTLADFSGTLTSPLYTTPIGETSAVAVGPVEDGIIVQSSAIVAFQNATNGGGASNNLFVTNPETGETGYLYLQQLRARNTGTARVEPGSYMTVHLPADVVFVEAYSNNATYTFEQTQTPWVSKGGDIVMHVPHALGSPGATSTAYTSYFYLRLFVPCAEIPVDTTAAGYRTGAEFDAVEVTATDTVPHHAGLTTTIAPPANTTGDACGTGGSFNKSDGGAQGEETSPTWTVSAAPAKGAFPYTDVLVQDRLPEGTTLHPTVTGVSPSDFVVYSCYLPDQVGDLTVAELLGYEAAGDCVMGRRADATHILWYAAQWGDSSGIQNFSATFYTTVPLGFIPEGEPEPYIITNTAVLTGEAPFPIAGTTAVRFEDTETHPIYSTSRPSMSAIAASGYLTSPQLLQPGESGVVSFGLQRSTSYTRPLNPTAILDIPPGVTIDSYDTIFVSSGACTTPTTYTEPVLGSNPMVWTFGSADDPYRLENVSNGCIRLRLHFTVSESYGFSSNAKVTFTAHQDAENRLATYYPQANRQFTIKVPSEMRVSVEPGCYEDRYPRFVITAANTGGEDLADIVVRAAIPGTADGVSTAESEFAGLGFHPDEATFYYDVGGALSTTPPADLADVDAVEMHLAALPAGADPVQFEVLLTTASAPGTTLHARAVMSEASLPPADTAFTQAVGVCPGTVDVTKFFDVDADGVQGAGEITLSGWTFDVLDSDGARVRSVTTGSDGTVRVLLNPGDYTFVEAIPTDTQGTWAATTAGGASQTLTVVDLGEHALLFGNTCTCPDDADGDPCTTLACQPDGSCLSVGTAAGTPCDDESDCTEGDQCDGNAVCVGTPIACDDGNECTADTCDVDLGCQHAPLDAVACSVDACSTGDTCSAGVCERGDAVDCDDGNDCTADSCDPVDGCVHAPTNEGGGCEDGLFCTVGDTCQAGACVAGGARDCAAGGAPECVVASCDEELGACAVLAVNEGGGCDDADPCTVDTTCHEGACEGAAASCDDQNECTDDACVPGVGCTNTPADGATCSDGNDCTLGDTCLGGACQAGTDNTCDDGNPCTTDGCGADGSCVYEPVDDGTTCDDEDACTGFGSAPDACVAGVCTGGGDVACSDGEDCTTDACDPDVGCVFTPREGDCEDGSLCTVGDTCGSGLCQPGAALDCDDDNACTDEVCVPATGCVTTNRDGGTCDDGDACTDGDTCADGVCAPGAAVVCDDDEGCTADACDPDTGCVYTPIGGDEPCEDGEICTVGDVCAGGVCVPGAVDA